MTDKFKDLIPLALAIGLALAMPLTLNTGTPVSAQAIGCGKIVSWVHAELRASVPDTWDCQYPKPDGTTGVWTCPLKAWSIPGYDECRPGESELCKCCRICKIKAEHVTVTCNSAGCQPHTATPPPVGTQVYYYPARLYLCTGEQSECKDKTPHQKCIEYELPDGSTDCGW